MNDLEKVLNSMTLEFFGTGQHKTSPSAHFAKKDAIFLDVRSIEEHKSISFSLLYHMPVMHIPICEIPTRSSEIPRDKIIGIFCSSGVRSTMVYLYLRSIGFDKVKIIEGGYPELAGEFKPGKLLKFINQKK